MDAAETAEDYSQINKSHSLKDSDIKQALKVPLKLSGDVSQLQPGTVLDKETPFCAEVFRLIQLNDVN